MKRRFTILTAAFALLAILAIPMGMMGQTTTLVSGSGTSGYSIPDGWTSSGTVEGGSYLKFDDGTITSPEFAPHNGLSFTYSVATFGSGTNHPLTIRILNASTDEVIVETTTATPTSSSYISTGSPLSLGDVTVAFKIEMYGPTGKGVRLRNYSITGTPAGGQQLTTSDLALVNAPVELEFDLYDNDDPQTISYTTSSTGAVTVSQSNYITATVNANNTITVTPVAVTNGPQTITVTQAADATYATGSVTFTVDIEDSTPFTGGDVTFLAGTDLGSTESNNSPDEMEKNGVTVYSTDAAFATAQYRLYQNSVTTISVTSGTITNIVFNGQSTSYPVNRLSVNDNNGSYTVNNNVGTWTGNSNEVSFSASGQARLSSIVVTVETSGTPDPTISASNVDIAFNATSGSITYTINNEPSPAGTLTAAVTDGNWLTLGQGTTSPIAFTCSANENTSARTATVTLTYTYNTDQTVSANVTITQAAAPVIYTTIPDLFAAATGTEISVLVTFNNWVVSGVSSNGKNVFVTDNNGNGFVIFDNNGGLNQVYSAGNILSGTAVSCTLKKYNGFAELLNVTATDLTITSGGTVTVADVAMADLAGVNTGALLHYDNLTCVLTTNNAGTTTFYNLTDGTTTIQVYNAIYAFGTLVEGKTYNITGIYQQYNNTKEILPRNAADIEEVEVQHEEYTLTVSNLNHVNLFIFGGEESETIISTEDGETTAQVYDGTEVLVSIDVEAGYVFQSLTITDGNGDAVETEELTPNEYYSFVMPANNVTISATAVEYVAPVTVDYELYSGDLVEGDYIVYYNGYAMKNTVESNRLFYETVTPDNNNTIATADATIVWHIAADGEYWTLYSADADAYAASTGANNKAQMLENGSDDKARWTVTVTGTENNTYEFVNKYNTGNKNLRNNGTYGFACYATTTGGALSLYKKVEDTPITYTLTINGYGDSDGGYYLIASPVTVDPSTNGMTTGDYDLYTFNQAEEDEWRNYKAGAFTNLEPGKGYLYAHKTGGEFTLSGEAYTGDGAITLYKTEGGDFPGWNLVGNPFNTSAQINRDFYILNSTGDELIQSNGLIAPMQGIFVIATTNDETLTFEPVGGEPADPMPEDKKVVLNINSNTSTGSMTIDRAVVRFGEGRTLPKFQLNPDNTKVYFTEGNENFAVVRSANEGEMPVSFKASENGRYTISVNAENIEMEYLHLIDNMTGADVDLLATPSYSFEANTTDYTSRFRLVFSANNGISEQSNETFAFFNGGNWVVNNEGEATLQVIDMTGRMLSSEQINGNYNKSLNLNAGVYVLRLSNGNVVKTQKVVID